MNVFGVGPTELFVVLIVILVLFGPDKLPELAKRIGGASREIRENLNSLNDQMNDALESSMELDKARMTPPAETPAVPAETAPPEAAALETGPAPVQAPLPDDNKILRDDSTVEPPPTLSPKPD